MPNWCHNTVKISHTDPAKLEELVQAIRDGKFCQSVIPVPQELTDNGSNGWYDFCVSHWGTKWDIDPESADCYEEDGVKHLCAEFQSAWTPPLGIYEALRSQGFGVEADYYEPDAGFMGQWKDGANKCVNI